MDALPPFLTRPPQPPPDTIPLPLPQAIPTSFGVPGVPERVTRATRGAVAWASVLVLALLLLALPVVSPFALAPGPVGRTLNDVFLRPPEDARPVILILFGLFAWTLVGMAQQRSAVRMGFRALETARETLRDAPERLSAVQVTDALAHVPQESVLVRAAQAVWNCREMQAPDLLAATDAAIDGAALPGRSGRGTPNLLMLISLFGTILGLSGVVSTLKPQFEAARASGDVTTILSNLQDTLTTMGTAFSATAYGILLAAITGALASGLASLRSDYLADVQRFAVSELAPRILPKAGEQTTVITELRVLIEQSQLRVETNVAHSEALLQQHAAFIGQSQQFVLQTEAAIKDATEDLHAALRDIGQNYVVKAAIDLIQVAQELDRVLGEAGADIHNALGELVGGAKELREAALNVKVAYGGLNTSIDRLEKSLSLQETGITEALKTQREEAAKLLQEQHAQAADFMTSQREHLAKATEAQGKRSEALVQTLQAHAADMEKRLGTVATEMKALLQRTDPKLPSAADWQKMQQTMDRAGEAARELSDAAGRMGRSGTVAPGGGSGSGNGVTSSDMQRLLSELAAQVNGGVARDVAQPLGARVEEVTRRVDRAGVVLEEIAQTLSDIRSQGTSGPNDGMPASPVITYGPSQKREVPVYSGPDVDPGEVADRYPEPPVRRAFVEDKTTVSAAPYQKKRVFRWPFWRPRGS